MIVVNGDSDTPLRPEFIGAALTSRYGCCRRSEALGSSQAMVPAPEYILGMRCSNARELPLRVWRVGKLKAALPCMCRMMKAGTAGRQLQTMPDVISADLLPSVTWKMNQELAWTVDSRPEKLPMLVVRWICSTHVPDANGETYNA